jgi:hypothetical protein
MKGYTPVGATLVVARNVPDAINVPNNIGRLTAIAAVVAGWFAENQGAHKGRPYRWKTDD